MIFLHQRFSAFIFHCDRGGVGYNYLLNAPDPDHVVQKTAPEIPVYASAWRQRHQLIISSYHDAVNGTFTPKLENTASVKDRFFLDTLAQCCVIRVYFWTRFHHICILIITFNNNSVTSILCIACKADFNGDLPQHEISI